MTRFGLALALLIAVYAALLYAPVFFKASDYLRGHRAERNGLSGPDDLEISHSKFVTATGEQDHV